MKYRGHLTQITCVSKVYRCKIKVIKSVSTNNDNVYVVLHTNINITVYNDKDSTRTLILEVHTKINLVCGSKLKYPIDLMLQIMVPFPSLQ